MNDEEKLLTMLDSIFGFDDKIKSTYRKLDQGFDDETNEHVFIIEYRTKTKNTVPGKPKKKQSRRKVKQADLLRQINVLANQLR